ncbi:hypothetical protein VC885_13150 [Citrobacter freundii]|uniref:hypothetical protein n=1 Tax=Citrobacter freundii TaxID=546 RepID=UPI0023B1AAEA|nr:hypothetical protein [Citrobacter freundii]MDE8814530.1 hypothetical protein [Citrobacter freundii]MDV2274971.1 hypothetical protein [Citrobacter freundii]MEB0855162.1 hypothetical protein [Citrobacter freundii]
MEILTWPLKPWITDVATLTTLAGFLLTLFVYKETKSLKSVFKRKARVPEIHKNLRDCAAKINDGLSEWDDNAESVKSELLKCAVYVESLKDKLAPKDKEKASEFLELVSEKSYFGKRKLVLKVENEDDAWNLYENLSILNTRLDEIVKDMNLD